MLVATCAIASSAAAHLGSTKYVVVEHVDGGARVTVRVETIDASMELGQGESPDEGRLRTSAPALTGWLARGMRVESDEGPCPARDVALSGFETRDARRYAVVDMEFRCPGGAVARVLVDDTVFADDPQHEAFVRVRFAEGDDAQILRRGRQRAELGVPPTTMRLVSTYLGEGALHLATGYDHVLFLLSLVLAAGLVAQREGYRKALRDVAVLVTAFTLGHSVTLVAAALDWIVLPSKPVEALIAASIVTVALLNVFRPRARKAMPWLAVGFGLVHGFGFSSVLAEQGLPSGARVLALLAFNVGIELAQLLFVTVVLFPLAALARYDGYEKVVVRGGSVVIAALAGVWLIERLAG